MNVAHANRLALFAMLMLFVGPLLSQMHAMAEPAPAWQTQISCGSHEAAGHPGSAGDDHALWAKCGYCTLLFSCPALPGSPAFSAGLAPFLDNVLALLPRLLPYLAATYASAQPRAPPRYS